MENIQANLEMLDKKIEAIENPTDLILLREMFSTGFSMSPVWMDRDTKVEGLFHDSDETT